MSKFIDALKRAAIPPATSIGFQTKNIARRNSQLLVVASVVSDSKKALKTIGTAGLDAILVRLHAQFDLSEIRKAVGDVPAGLRLDVKDMESELTASVDFIVYSMKMPVSFLNKATVGKVMEIEPSLDLGSIRAINGVGSIVDAVMLGGDDVSFTVERLLYCQRISDLVTQPVLVSVDSSVKGSELATLCEAGADGIVITDVCSASAYAEIRKAISGLPRNIKRKSAGTAIVPKLSGTPSVDEEEQEEDE